MIQLRDLACDSPEGRPLLEGLDLAVPKGGNLLVTGASGSGKSRLLRAIAGTERPRRGEVRIAGIAIWPGDGVLSLAGRVRVGFAFPAGGLLSNLSLEANVALPLRFLGLPPAEVARRAGAALERLGLQSVSRLRPHAVSGSARKHANLARVLALEPQLVLLDEPLEGLDTADRAVAQDLVEAWAGDSACTLVMALEEAQAFATLDAERLHLSPVAMPMEST
ncbi:MAG TPA: ATP-binding cassette domain-containing protein [Geothrix sp.]|jgi:ABC-type transporter Mla maintaining outer membrane lipid asymmetry ATPase subunit MlaF